MPDCNSLSLHPGLATDGAGVLAILADLFYNLPEQGTVMGTIFYKSHLVHALGLFTHVMNEPDIFRIMDLI